MAGSLVHGYVHSYYAASYQQSHDWKKERKNVYILYIKTRQEMNVTPWLNTDTLKITSSSSNNSREKHQLSNFCNFGHTAF